MSATSPLLSATCQRPPKLYRYSQRQWLERALQLGEFQLRPADGNGGNQILPFGPRPATQGYLTLSLTSVWDESLFGTFAGADSCLVIHDAEEFGERIHRAVQRVLPAWAGIDAAVSYGAPSPLGAAFSKPRSHAAEKEWLFAWRPMQAALTAHPVVIKIGNIEPIAELRQRNA